MGATEVIRASYRRPELPEYEGNPLLEALPPILGAEQMLDQLVNLPAYNPEERTHPTELRLHYLDRLFDIVQPQPEHLKIAATVSRLIRHGYKSRNPLTPAFAAHAYQLATNNYKDVRPPPQFAKCRSGAYVTGLSGIGKSTIIERILGTYPQTIVHEQFQGQQFTQSQVVWLKLDCPHDGSQKQLCLSFFAALDQALGGTTDYFEQNIRARHGVEGYLATMHRLSHSYHLGFLALDEIQHLTAAPRGGETKTLNLLVNLMNGIGVPVMMSGTLESASLFAKTFRNARRVSFSGPAIMDRYSKDDPRFRLFLETLWHYQWTKTPVQLDDAMVDAMHDASQAVTDVVVAIYMLNQQIAITAGKDETFSAESIRSTIPEHFPILQPALDALRRGDKRAYEQFRELLPPTEQWATAMSVSDEPKDLAALTEYLVKRQMERVQRPSDATESAAETEAEVDTLSTSNDGPLVEGLAKTASPNGLPDIDAHILRPARRTK